jgi:hypothetical protein
VPDPTLQREAASAITCHAPRRPGPIPERCRWSVNRRIARVMYSERDRLHATMRDGSRLECPRIQRVCRIQGS